MIVCGKRFRFLRVAQQLVITMSYIIRNIDIILSVIGAPLMTAVFALILKSLDSCSGSVTCSEYRTEIAIFCGLSSAFFASKVIYKSIHGVGPKG
jgi:hypothetical protein